MKIQYYHHIVLSLIVSVTAMIMSESVASAAPKAWLEMPSGTTKSLNGIWGTSATDIFVVGSSGTILHYDGTSWTPMIGTTERLASVWGSSSNDVFVAGSIGTILHYDGTDWTTMPSVTTEDLFGIWGASANEVFAIGTTGAILYYDGSAWSAMSSNTSEELRGIWGSSSTNIFTVGLNGTILHYDGSNWTNIISNTTKDLYSIWGNSNNNVFAVGQDGTILRYNGSDWTAMTSNTTKHLYSVWGSANDNIFAIGLDTSLHYDGSDWILLDPGTADNYLDGVWGADCAECKFIVGEQGKILQLAPALTISTAGSGTGTVAAAAGLNDGFSNCDTTCKEYYSIGDSVEITATAGSNSNFTGWSGDCSGTTNPLTVTLNTSLNCTATFEVISHPLVINKTGSGTGTITGSNGINCGSICSKDYPQGTTVTLTATPQNGSTFTDWSGDCSGSNNSVTLTMDNSFTCTAKFDVIPQQTLSINKTGTGTGTVTGSNGMNCGSICSKNYQQGTTVTLTATPQNDSTFGGWSGDCSGGLFQSLNLVLNSVK